MFAGDVFASAISYVLLYGAPFIALGGGEYLSRRSPNSSRHLFASALLYFACVVMYTPVNRWIVSELAFGRTWAFKHWYVVLFVLNVFAALALGLILRAAWIGRAAPPADVS